MRKQQLVKMPDPFHALLEYLRNMGYAEKTIAYFEGHFRWIARVMKEKGYETYTPEAYASVIQNITDARAYEDLTEYQKRHYHSATILYEFQQTGSYTFRHKKAEEVFQGGLKTDIEEYMENRKLLLQANTTWMQYRLDLLRFNIFLNEKGMSDISQLTTVVILQYIRERMSRFTQPTIRHTPW